MMILRALLVAWLTVAFVATAWAQCGVGASFEHAVSPARHDHMSMGHHAKHAPRACDAMVQATAPQAPAVAPSLTSVAVPMSVVAAVLQDPLLVAVRRAERPPDRSRRFKDTYARTGRLLV